MFEERSEPTHILARAMAAYVKPEDLMTKPHELVEKYAAFIDEVCAYMNLTILSLGVLEEIEKDAPHRPHQAD